MKHPLIQGLEVKLRTLRAAKPRSKQTEKEINDRIASAEAELKSLGAVTEPATITKSAAVTSPEVKVVQAKPEQPETVTVETKCGEDCDCLPGECENEQVEEKVEAEIEVEVEASETATDWSSVTRDELKAELAKRNIDFANNAKTTKLVSLLEESDQ
jgi:hypothetical protein